MQTAEIVSVPVASPHARMPMPLDRDTEVDTVITLFEGEAVFGSRD